MMKFRLLVLSLIVTGAAMAVTQSFGRAQSGQDPAPGTAAAQQTEDPDQEGTRGAFLTSRPKAAEKPSRSAASSSEPRRSRRRPVGKTTTTGTTSSSGTTSTSGSSSTSGSMTSGSTSKNGGDLSKKKPIAQKIGLGLTLFMRDSNGLAVRVDPTHEFHKGDRVRVLLETNTDGHLYIFNTTDEGPPVMIYPDPQLDEAGNYLQAHVPLEIPSSVAAEEGLRWFRFDEHAGKERLYVVFTREPLSGVPIEDDLLKYCGEDKAQCAWHPPTETWASLQKHSSVPAPIAKVQNDGKAQTVVEHQAATRGIGLSREDPEPSLVMMNASSDSGLLVAALDLFHR
jgi:hypothetical protein